MTIVIPNAVVILAILIVAMSIVLGGSYVIAKIPNEWVFIITAVIFFSITNGIYREIMTAIDGPTWAGGGSSGFIYPALFAGMWFEKNRSRRSRY